MRLLLVGAIRLYQLFVSPLLPASCRFYPSCSHYALVAIREHGVARGGWLAVARIARCHPWHPGGVDLVPKAKS
jgi:putative membrane protein insertion efficiency factor